MALISSGDSFFTITFGSQATEARNWASFLGGSVFILATLFNFMLKLVGKPRGGVNSEVGLIGGRGCMTLGVHAWAPRVFHAKCP